MSKQYLDQVIRQAVYLEGLKAGTTKDFNQTAKDVDDYLARNVYSIDLASLTPDKLNDLLDKVGNDLQEIYGEYIGDLKDTIIEVYQHSYQAEAASLTNAFVEVEAAGLASTAVTTTVAAKAISETPVLLDSKAHLIDDLLDKFTSSEAKAVVDTLRASHFKGQSVPEVIKAIRGTRANKYKDGLIDVTRRHAEAIARTGIQHAAVSARQQFGEDNDDVIESKQFVAVLDSRTTTQCKSLDGKTVPLDSPLKPPFHVNCRTSMVFILKPEFRGANETTGKRRAGDERIDADMNYYDWLKTQSEAFQDDVLGKTRAKLFRDGGLSSEEFGKLNLNKNFEPLTLAEMRAKNPLIFERAGL